MIKIGFIINPIAGMGGRVGLKGTDGVVDKAISLGAIPVAPQKALGMLKEFHSSYSNQDNVHWYTCEGSMGDDALTAAKITNKTIIYTPSHTSTSAHDTREAGKKFLESQIDLLVFCGGDGTARDLFSVLDKKIPLLGIPAGVKMHSSVFGITTSATAKMLHEFIKGRLTIGDTEIMDLDEDLYRKGEWKVRLFGVVKGIVEPTYIQVGKESFESVSDDAVKEELADHIHDEMEKNKEVLYLFGSGGTIDFIAKKLGFDHTLLGIDAIYQNQLVGKDLNESQILDLLNKHKKAKVLLSPIGAQGFILGRGNLQLSPRVIKKIGLDNILIVATPSKLSHTSILRVDTGDRKVDALFMKREFYMVLIGYRLSRVVKIQTNNF